MRIALAAAAVAGLVALTAWFFEMPLQKAILVAPITVLAFGAAFGLVVLWTKVIVESVRNRRS